MQRWTQEEAGTAEKNKPATEGDGRDDAPSPTTRGEARHVAHPPPEKS